MKLKTIIDNVDKSKKNSDYVNISELANEFNIYDNIDDSDERIKSYFFATWQCTDTFVGGRVYFLDDEPVCISWQNARKSDENFAWISNETFQKVHQYIVSLISKDLPEPKLVDFDEELGDGNQVEYSSQLLTDKLIYAPTKEIVSVVKKYRDMNDIKSWGFVKIKFPDGEVKKVEMGDVLVPFNLELIK